MWVITTTLFIAFFLIAYARCLAEPVGSVGLGPASGKPNKLIALMVLTCLCLVAGLRTTVGDTPFYMLTYTLNHFTWDHLFSNDDWGFVILQIFLQKISEDPQILVFVTALITQILTFLVLYKYSNMLELSVYLYIVSGSYIVSMNGIRQCLAAAMFFAATKFLFEGKFIKYSIIILIAATFHETALILIPIYFFARMKSWTWVTYLFLALSVLIVMAYGHFTSALYSVIGNTQYGEYGQATHQGANILRVFIYAAPLIPAYIGREKLRRLFPKIDIIVNMSLLALVFMIISTKDWIFARFTIYFGLYDLLLIPMVITTFVKNERKLVYYFILTSYFIYYYYDSLRVYYSSLFMKYLK